MNKLLVGTIALSMLGASLAYAQPDPADQRAPAPPTPGAAGTPDQSGQAAPVPTPAPAAQGQSTAPYPYGSVGSYQPSASAGYRGQGGDASSGDYSRSARYRGGYHYRHHHHGHAVRHHHHHHQQ